ncbi:MAG: 50S ribosomal protein L10 [Acidimicrobiia bacterium]|nr:50S ribosomal protein L10 [Acidimicrobiia bacterium]MDX2468017.1 50S ribosomal protein L10 [Acidimicrobiia bacterium]
MARPEKVQAVAEIKERLERSQAVFLAEYAGLSVKQQQTLRRGLREGGAEFQVVKMTLARRAAAELELADLDELFIGPTGLAFADGDPVTAAKALKDFAKENEAFTIKGGLLGREFLTPERISELADIESREVLLSKIAGVMQAPMANLAGLLAALPRNLASAMQQLVEKKEEAGGGEAPAAEADSSDEEPAATADAADADASVEDASVEDASVDEEVTGETVAADASVEDAPVEDAAPAPEETEEADKPAEAVAETEDAPEAAADSAESDDSGDDEADSDGDDAKSVDKDQAETAEEA